MLGVCEEDVPLIFIVPLCPRWKSKKCRKGRKCKFLHADYRDNEKGELRGFVPTRVLDSTKEKGGERGWIHTGDVLYSCPLPRLRGANLLPWVKKFLGAHDPVVPDILGDIVQFGDYTKIKLNAPLLAKDILKKEFIDYFEREHDVFHCTSIPCAMSILRTGHLMAREQPPGAGDAPTGCYFAREGKNDSYNVGASFKAILFGCKKVYRKATDSEVCPTGMIYTLPGRSARDRVTDSFSHKLENVTFHTALLEAYLQKWVEEGERQMHVKVGAFSDMEKKPHQFCQPDSARKNDIIETTLRTLDDRHRDLRQRLEDIQ